MSDVICGPLIRYIDHRCAVIWLELDQDMEVVVNLHPVRNGISFPPITVRAWPVQVGSTYYAWVHCRHLLPATWYEYEIQGIADSGEHIGLWPDRELPGSVRPSLFRTLPLFSVEGVRVAFGSCRAGFPPTDPKAFEEGVDALHAMAIEISKTAAEREAHWPHFFIFTGDQIYGDTLSEAKKREFARRPENRVTNNQATTYAQYASLYREAWTTVPQIRWMLSCIPSFMVFDDHDVIDDWNISEEWIKERLLSLGWVRLMSEGLLAYWIYQGAGNLPPKEWRSDERLRHLIPRYRSPFRDVTRRLGRMFREYIMRRRKADWGFAIDVPGTRFVVGDTRMSRKLTGKRLLMDDYAWTNFVKRARNNKARNTILVVPGPFLVGHPMHDLLSRVAESIEGNPPSVVGAIAGGLVGGLIGGPAGALAGAIAGSVGGEFLLDKYGEDIIREADIELWAAFPTSFNRMLTLLEQLVDGVQTTPKRFVGMIAGDVHHANVMRADFQKTSRRASLLHFTMSPLQRKVAEDDQDLLRDLEGGAWYVNVINALERPSFVEKQRERLDWYPLDRDGQRTTFAELNEWNFFGKFVGELNLSAISLEYRYREAVSEDSQLQLREITNHSQFIL